MAPVLRVAAAVALGGAALAACETRPAWQQQAVGSSTFDSTGTFVHAGVSARTDVDVEPLRVSALGGDATGATGASLDLYRKRCGACHDAPDPSMKTAEHWSFLIRRMREKTATAGLIPMSDEETDSVLDFLRRHAAR